MLPDHVQTFIDAEIAANQTDLRDLRADILNGTLKPSPEPSHTDALIERADIVVLATPIWLGDQSSMIELVIERLYG